MSQSQTATLRPNRVEHAYDLVGYTPVVRLSRIVPEGSARIYVKLESANPGGSVKDRIALSMICLLYTSPSPRDRQKSRMPSSA